LVWDYGKGLSFLMSDNHHEIILKPRLIFTAAQHGARRRCRAAFWVWLGVSFFYFL
jgi:hypothetical protein